MLIQQQAAHGAAVAVTARLCAVLLWCVCPDKVMAWDKSVPAPPALPVKGYVLMDAASGEVLAEQNADERLEPASLTKILTVYTAAHELAAGHVKLSDVVRVSAEAWRTPGSRMFVQPDKPVTVDELLHGIAIQSGNDASVALAEHVAGSANAFVDLMNTRRAEVGMTASSFANPDGLPDPLNYTTARDMARLADALISDYPDIYKLFGIKEYHYNKITQPNRNRLLSTEPGADGVKTGHTEAAGYCLVGSVERDGMRLISVVMGAAGDEERTQASRSLLNYGFRFFETHRLYGKGQVLQSPQVWMGDSRTVDATVAEDLYITVPRGQYQSLKAELVTEPRLVAPIAAGQELGRMKVSLGEEVLLERPVIAGQSVAEGGWIRYLADSVLMLVY